MEYDSNNAVDERAEERLETPIGVDELGQSVTEGQRFGAFRQSVNAAIRSGAGSVELQTQMGGGAEAVGAESYGKDAREELREIQDINEVQFSSVHAPTQVGNLSGFSPRQGGVGEFSDEQRKASTEEVRKAIEFAADVTRGGAVVVHTGEYQRPMSEADWAKNPDGTYKFIGYMEEPGKAVKFLVDDRTGRVIGDVRKSQIVREPVYKTEKMNGVDVWVDEYGNPLNPDNPDDLFKRVPEWNEDFSRFNSRILTWDDFVQRAEEYNNRHKEEIDAGQLRAKLPEEMFYKTQIETQILQYRGSSLYHGKYYEGYRDNVNKLRDALKTYQQLEDATPEEEKWQLMTQKYGFHLDPRFVKPDNIPITTFIKDELRKAEQEMTYVHEASAAADAQADTMKDTLDHMVPVEAYAKEQSMKSYAEAGIHAMDVSQSNPHVKRDVFVAPENIFPEMGWGSHPEELIDLVQSARRTMVETLTSKTIKDPEGKLDERGNVRIVENPYYRPNYSKEQAAKEANDHIKATFDTQHLGMWRKHFQPEFIKEKGRIETKEETDARFNNWYMDEVKKLEKSGIIGNIHVVDSLGGGHHHLAPGQGNLPVVDAVSYLKKKGYDHALVSEAHGEEMINQGRILTETWKAFGSPIYGAGGPVGHGGGKGGTFGEVHHSYFGENRPPYYVFGAYSPSNDWTLWTQVPME